MYEKKILLFALSIILCCLPFPAAQSDYAVTETELIRIESISERQGKLEQDLLLQASSNGALESRKRKSESLSDELTANGEKIANTLRKSG